MEAGRTTWFLLGLILVLAAIFVVFEYTDAPSAASDGEEEALDGLQMKDDGLIPMVLPIATVRIVEPPRLRAEIPQRINVVDDEPDSDSVDEPLPPPDGDAGARDLPLMPGPPLPAPSDTVPPSLLMHDKPVDFRVVESLPQFPGGAVEFVKWLTRNLRYPVAAERQKIEGRVVVQFVVERDGSISGLKVVESVHDYLDREALRVMRLMPEWMPGLQNDEPCRTMVCIPIVFKL